MEARHLYQYRHLDENGPGNSRQGLSLNGNFSTISSTAGLRSAGISGCRFQPRPGQPDANYGIDIVTQRDFQL
jgi:hypothetical protein